MSDAAPLEREAKFDVAAEYQMPTLHDLGVEVADLGVQSLDAVYWDTAELLLSGSHHSLRRRLGRYWTLKGPSTLVGLALTRSEQEWPDQPAIPEAALQQLTSLLAGHQLLAVAHLRSERHILMLAPAGEAALLEVDDDDVSVLDESGKEVLAFREIEVEVRRPGAAAEHLLEVVADRLMAAGARSHRQGKYSRALRALGYELPPRE